VGLVAVHTLADRVGAAPFINTVSELGRGQDNLTFSPVRA
jgi:hypothetical protein